MDISKIMRYGNSYVFKISKAYMEHMNLKRGDYVTARLTEKGLLIQKLQMEKGENHDERRET
jgi:antitoxin component of MazEF toxin-antitoxin module